MRALIDTNLFVYASFDDFPYHQKSLDFLKSCAVSSDSWYVTWGIVYEYAQVVTRTPPFKNPLSLLQAWDNVEKFLSFPNVSILREGEEHSARFASLAKEHSGLTGTILHDFHNLVIMKENDLNVVYTADTDFHRFKGIRVINPLQS